MLSQEVQNVSFSRKEMKQTVHYLQYLQLIELRHFSHCSNCIRSALPGIQVLICLANDTSTWRIESLRHCSATSKKILSFFTGTKLKFDPSLSSHLHVLIRPSYLVRYSIRMLSVMIRCSSFYGPWMDIVVVRLNADCARQNADSFVCRLDQLEMQQRIHYSLYTRNLPTSVLCMNSQSDSSLAFLSFPMT